MPAPALVAAREPVFYLVTPPLPEGSGLSSRLRGDGRLPAMWPAGDDHVPGLPAPQEIIASYAALSERDMSAIDWYAVTLGLFERAQELKGDTLN